MNVRHRTTRTARFAKVGGNRTCLLAMVSYALYMLSSFSAFWLILGFILT
jgi:hypothetical protein